MTPKKKTEAKAEPKPEPVEIKQPKKKGDDYDVAKTVENLEKGRDVLAKHIDSLVESKSPVHERLTFGLHTWTTLINHLKLVK